MRHYFFLKKSGKDESHYLVKCLLQYKFSRFFLGSIIIFCPDHLKCSSFGLLMLRACQMKQCMECASSDCLLCLYVNHNIYAPTVLSPACHDMRHYFFLKKERKVAIWKGIFVPIIIILFSDHLKCSRYGLLMLSACQVKQCMECASGDCLLCLYVNHNIYAPTVLSPLAMI